MHRSAATHNFTASFQTNSWHAFQFGNRGLEGRGAGERSTIVLEGADAAQRKKRKSNGSLHGDGVGFQRGKAIDPEKMSALHCITIYGPTTIALLDDA